MLHQALFDAIIPKAVTSLTHQPPVILVSRQQRVLLEHYLSQEHALLRQSSVPEGVSGSLPGRERTLPSGHLHNRRVGGNRGDIDYNSHFSPPSRSKAVEDMFRKARLKRCFARILRQKQGADENQQHRSAFGHAPQQLHAGHLEQRVQERGEEVQPESPQPEGLPVVHGQGIHEQGSPERPVPAVGLPSQRGQGEEEAERRRLLIRQFFRAARRRDDVARGGDRLDLGADGAPAATGGAPCFTVGGRGSSAIASARARGEQGLSDDSADGLADGLPEIGLRRANLLRRVLQAMRCTQRRASGCFNLVAEDQEFEGATS